MTTIRGDTRISLTEKGIRIMDWRNAHQEEANEKQKWFDGFFRHLAEKSGIPSTEPYINCFNFAMVWPLTVWIDGITTGLTKEEAENNAIDAFVKRFNELVDEVHESEANDLD
jgi:hypothetical protein